jgi:hypothetical protein
MQSGGLLFYSVFSFSLVSQNYILNQAWSEVPLKAMGVPQARQDLMASLLQQFVTFPLQKVFEMLRLSKHLHIVEIVVYTDSFIILVDIQ